MARQLLLALALLAAIHCACAAKSVLVLLQSGTTADKYSGFIDGLGAAGFAVEVKGHKDTGLKLREYGTWLYDDLVLFAPKAEGFGGSIDQQTILDFVDSGHNVLLAVNSEVSEAMRNLAAEFGVDLDDRGTKLFDHFSYATTADGKHDHNLVASYDLADAPVIVGGPYKDPVLFRGLAATVPADAELATVVLSAPATSYSHDPRKSMLEPPSLMVGAAASLVTAVQARNNARMVVAGSTDMFSNDLAGSANRAFCLTLALWAFQERGVLVASNLRHHLLGSDEQPAGYRVNDEVEFAVDVMEVTGGVAKPYKVDDLQVEFVMLNPYIRLPLQHDGQGVFSLRFMVPDVYGVFKYVVDYSRRGYSYIKLTHQVPVRPFKHNEYERFLVCAYPYYASALSVMLAFFSLSFFFLYHK
ncbi:Dolichyl-diphosphooligosaccharide--protein glycosyltransferase subunit [Tetrabaena socialis]|uniref:Dolichyl-diphosphooligosaccharide--protein glycosyltransferase 48 kDa subunit n=1 Tax=Tetrabaena socialis TaxID=47790 RepID=A0A2J7ZWT9_9CHLO|nr:Dolichyl-diphosphooligosaccharide--protein glycosyltransferase subunit [Tetrabaena socialis]|eukprot:PNH04740.1 Dolichyl-diphosphooligosaccharide--protein glycosyltransferase subunit [Tetrabaena socialis]